MEKKIYLNTLAMLVLLASNSNLIAMHRSESPNPIPLCDLERINTGASRGSGSIPRHYPGSGESTLKLLIQHGLTLSVLQGLFSGVTSGTSGIIEVSIIKGIIGAWTGIFGDGLPPKQQFIENIQQLMQTLQQLAEENEQLKNNALILSIQLKDKTSKYALQEKKLNLKEQKQKRQLQLIDLEIQRKELDLKQSESLGRTPGKTPLVKPNPMIQQELENLRKNNERRTNYLREKAAQAA